MEQNLQKCLRHISCVLLMSFLVSAGTALAQKDAAAHLESYFGVVIVDRGGAQIFGEPNLELYASDVLFVKKNSTAMVKFTDGSSVVASENSGMAISQYKARAQGKTLSAKMMLDVIKGKLRFFFKKTDATVRTQNATIGVRGTTFFVDASSKNTMVVMVQGKVAVANMADPSKVVHLDNDQLTRVMERGAPDVPVKVPANVAVDFKNSFKNVDLVKAGGAIEAPKVEIAPEPTNAPLKEKEGEKENKKEGDKEGEKNQTEKEAAGPKAVEDGKLVVSASGESSIAPPITAAGAPQIAPPLGGAGEPGAAGPVTPSAPPVDAAAAAEKSLQQITTGAQRPIDSQKSSTQGKTRVGLSAP